MENVLYRLFDSSGRVKIIRLFLLNPDVLFTPREISRRTKMDSLPLRREISLLKSIGFVKQGEEKVEESVKVKGRIKIKKKKIQGLKLNPIFPFIHALKNLILNTVPVDRQRLLRMLNSAGRMKLIVLSGIFIQSDSSRTDLLLVGDSIRRPALERILRNIEAEIGKELVYAIFTTNEFLYRMGMYDRFVRDILDYPHEKLIDKFGL